MFCVSLIILCVIPLAKNQWVVDDSGCLTPKSAIGDCIPIKECQPILDAITKTNPLPTWLSEEIASYYCGVVKNSVKVCCPYDKSALQYLDGDEFRKNIASKHSDVKKVLPNDCGFLYTADRIIQGDVTLVFEYPWMVLLSYKTRTGIDFKCAGTIINEWYILTAAHCISNLGQVELIGVRAGEHNISSPIDCNEFYMQDLQCAEKVQDVGVEKSIPHPNYDPKSLQNDIGLIRLQRSLNVSVDSVKPICLPIGKDVSGLNLTSQKLTVTGWGWTEKGQKSDVLLKVNVPVWKNEECQDVYKAADKSITENQLCAGGRKEDSCEGDSGGPLQGLYYYNDDVRYVQQGIVSYGPKLCGGIGIPGVYTRVDKYMQWILDNIQ